MNGLTIPNPPTHLSDDQLEDLLLGEPAPEAAAHLNVCPLCQSKSEAFTSTLAHFNQATLDWAEAFGASHAALTTRPATVPRAFEPSPRAAGGRFFPAYAWAFAVAIVLLAAMLFLRPAPTTPIQTARTPQPDAALRPSATPDPQIAADNMLLANIDTALNQPDPAPSVLNLEPALERATSDSASSR